MGQNSEGGGIRLAGTGAMTLKAILLELRRGTHPKNLPGGHYLGAGLYRTAYRVGDYVVKESHQACGNCRPKEPLPCGVKLPRAEWNAGGYVVQPYYPPIDWEDWERAGLHSALYVQDLHPGNIGKDVDGTLVAFDW